MEEPSHSPSPDVNPSPWIGRPIIIEDPEPVPAHEAPPRHRRAIVLPVVLFVLTCLSTWLVGGGGLGDWQNGTIYAACLMTILGCHEAGHFLQTRRCRVEASLPYFIPFPISWIGTMGAVIAMEPRIGNRKDVFDIGISGPLAGLVPTLIFCVIGVHYSKVMVPGPNGAPLGDPLIFSWITYFVKGPIPAGQDLVIGPMAMAAWVGMLITSVNLFPIGQLDGGHVMYAILGRRAHAIGYGVLGACAASVAVGLIFFHQKSLTVWVLMLVILIVLRPKHPATANDHHPIGWFRTILGCCTLALIPLMFTPQPFVLDEPPPPPKHHSPPPRRVPDPNQRVAGNGEHWSQLYMDGQAI